MTFGLALSARADRARRLADAALSGTDLQHLDRIVRAVTTEVGADSASLSLLSDRQVTLSACGLERLEMQRGEEFAFDDTICANALRNEGPLVITDAVADSRVSSIPAVQAGLVGAYLGIPLTHEDAVVGVLCAVCAQPHAWTDAQLTTLARLAGEAVAELGRLAAGVPVG